MTAPADSILAREQRLSRLPFAVLRSGVWWGFAFAPDFGGRVSGSSSRPAYRLHSVSADTSASGAEDVHHHTEPAQRGPPTSAGLSEGLPQYVQDFVRKPPRLPIDGEWDGIFFNQGQCCNAGSRLYIDRDVYDEVVQGISHAARKIKVGPGLEGRARAVAGRATSGTSCNQPSSPTPHPT
jgi:hypothetical protein